MAALWPLYTATSEPRSPPAMEPTGKPTKKTPSASELTACFCIAVEVSSFCAVATFSARRSGHDRVMYAFVGR